MRFELFGIINTEIQAMPSIEFRWKGQSVSKPVKVQEGESILDAALNGDIPLQHACGGFCSCTTCHVEVVSGAENLSRQEEDEIERMESNGILAPNSRLSCQTRIRGGGSIVVNIVNMEE